MKFPKHWKRYIAEAKVIHGLDSQRVFIRLCAQNHLRVANLRRIMRKLSKRGQI